MRTPSLCLSLAPSFSSFSMFLFCISVPQKRKQVLYNRMYFSGKCLFLFERQRGREVSHLLLHSQNVCNTGWARPKSAPRNSSWVTHMVTQILAPSTVSLSGGHLQEAGKESRPEIKAVLLRWRCLRWHLNQLPTQVYQLPTQGHAFCFSQERMLLK